MPAFFMSRANVQSLSEAWRSSLVEVSSPSVSTARSWSVWSSPVVFFTLTFCAFALAILVSWQMDLQWRAIGLSARIRQLEHDGVEASAQLEEAARAQAQFETFLRQAREVSKKWTSSSWTPALRSIATSLERGVALQWLRIYEQPANSGEYLVEMTATASGEQPRAMADHFLERFRAGLAGAFQTTVEARLDTMKAMGSFPANAGETAVEFTITARFGLSAHDEPGKNVGK